MWMKRGERGDIEEVKRGIIGTFATAMTILCCSSNE
jgi:hypothetical protein